MFEAYPRLLYLVVVAVAATLQFLAVAYPLVVVGLEDPDVNALMWSAVVLVALRFCAPAIVRAVSQWRAPSPTLRVSLEGITRITSRNRASFVAWEDVKGFTIHKINGVPYHLSIDLHRGCRARRADGALAPANRRWLLESATSIPCAQLPMPVDQLVPRMTAAVRRAEAG